MSSDKRTRQSSSSQLAKKKKAITTTVNKSIKKYKTKRITISSALPEFLELNLNKIPLEPEDYDVEWAEFLRRQQVTVVPTRHLIKTQKSLVKVSEKVLKTVENYTGRTISARIVPIVKLKGSQLKGVANQENQQDQNNSDDDSMNLNVDDDMDYNESLMQTEQVSDDDQEDENDSSEEIDNQNPSYQYNYRHQQNEESCSEGEGEEDAQNQTQPLISFSSPQPPHSTSNLPPSGLRIQTMNVPNYAFDPREFATDQRNSAATEHINGGLARPLNLTSSSKASSSGNNSLNYRDNFRFSRPNRMAPALTLADTTITVNSTKVEEQMNSSSNSFVQMESCNEYEKHAELLKDQIIQEFQRIPPMDLMRMREELMAMHMENRRYAWSRQAPMLSCFIISAFRL